MEVTKPPGWNRDLFDRSLVAEGDLGTLAPQALPGPGERVSTHGGQKLARQQGLSGPAAGMSEAVDGVKT